MLHVAFYTFNQDVGKFEYKTHIHIHLQDQTPCNLKVCMQIIFKNGLHSRQYILKRRVLMYTQFMWQLNWNIIKPNVVFQDKASYYKTVVHYEAVFDPVHKIICRWRFMYTKEIYFYKTNVWTVRWFCN